MQLRVICMLSVLFIMKALQAQDVTNSSTTAVPVTNIASAMTSASFSTVANPTTASTVNVVKSSIAAASAVNTATQKATLAASPVSPTAQPVASTDSGNGVLPIFSGLGNWIIFLVIPLVYMTMK